MHTITSNEEVKMEHIYRDVHPKTIFFYVILTDLLGTGMPNKNKGGLYNATEDMQTATDSYLGRHQDYVVIPGLLALQIGPHGVCNLCNL